jgi:hypothetical protein
MNKPNNIEDVKKLIEQQKLIKQAQLEAKENAKKQMLQIKIQK